LANKDISEFALFCGDGKCDSEENPMTCEDCRIPVIPTATQEINPTTKDPNLFFPLAIIIAMSFTLFFLVYLMKRI